MASNPSSNKSEEQKRSLAEIRAQLDKIDHTLLEALASRHQLIHETAALKKENKTALRDCPEVGRGPLFCDDALPADYRLLGAFSDGFPAGLSERAG
jgi:hypothetical protein